jgi:hypothetical protein
VKRDIPEQAVATRLDEYNFAFGSDRDALRQKYAALSVGDLNKLAIETAVLAAELRALYWERIWSSPTGN